MFGARCTEVAAAVVLHDGRAHWLRRRIPDLRDPRTRRREPIDRCDWPMWGHGLDRTFSYPCRTDLSPSTVGDLERRWFFNTADVVTSTPGGRRRHGLRRRLVGPVLRAAPGGRPAPLDLRHRGARQRVLGADRLVARGRGRRRGADGLRGGRQDRLRAQGRRRRAAVAPRAAAGARAARTRPSSRPRRRSSTAWSSSVGTCTTATRASRRACSRSTPRPVRNGGRSAPRSRPPGAATCGARPRSTSSAAWSSSARRNCPSSPEGWGPYTEALFALDLDTGEPLLVVPAARPEQRRLRLRRRTEPVRGRGRPRARRPRQQGRRVLRGRPRHRRGGLAAEGGGAGHHPPGQQLLDRRLHRSDRLRGRHHRRGHGGGRRPVPPRHRRHHRRDPLAATGGRGDLRRLGRGERRRVRRRHRLHAARPRPADRRGALAPGDDRRGGRWRGRGRQRRHRGGRHPRARPRRAEPHQRGHPVLARRRSRHPDLHRVDHQHRVHLDDRAAGGARAGVRRARRARSASTSSSRRRA